MKATHLSLFILFLLLTLNPTTSPARNLAVDWNANWTATTNVSAGGGSSTLAYWELDYRLSDSSGAPWIYLNSGTSNTSGTLGTFNPQMLLNGQYDIILSAYDDTGAYFSSLVTVVVKGGQKVGPFSISYTDLTLPVAGLRIDVTRTYDTRDKSPGDFGVGWKMSTTNAVLQKPGNLGYDWNEWGDTFSFVLQYHYASARTRRVTVTLPGGQVYTFTPTVSPADSWLIKLAMGQVVYQPSGDTHATLTAIESDGTPIDPEVFIGDKMSDDDNTNVNSLTDWRGVGLYTDVACTVPYNPTKFVLTLPDGRQFCVSDPDSPDSSDPKGLQWVEDWAGNTINFSYVDATRVNSISSTSKGTGGSTVTGKTVTIGYDGSGYINAITDPNGGVLKYTTDSGTHNLTSFTDQSGDTSTYDYDAQHNLIDIHDPRGIVPAKNVYDSSGRLLYTIDDKGHEIQFDYSHADPTDHYVTTTDRAGNITVTTYDPYGNVVETSQELNGKAVNIRYTFTDPSNPDKATSETHYLNGRAITTTKSYDGSGNVASTMDALTNTTQTTYNGFSSVQASIDAYGVTVTNNAYDSYLLKPSNNIVSSTDAMGVATNYTYTFYDNNDHANPSLVTVGNGITGGNVSFSDDGSVSTTGDALGHYTYFTYDSNGNKLTSTTHRTKPDGTTETLLTQYVYDAQNRVVKTIYPDGTSTQTVYNSIGKVDHSVDKLGRPTYYYYDDFGMPSKTVYPDGTSTQTIYDNDGRVSMTIDRAGRIMQNTYDALGRVISTAALADTSGTLLSIGGVTFVTHTTYDELGRVVASTDENGHATQTKYDDAGRSTQTLDALSTPNTTNYTYDKNGRQTKVTDAAGHWRTFDYDPDGRQTVTHFMDGTSTTNTYDAAGRKTLFTDQAGRQTHYYYDGLSRLIAVRDMMGKKYFYD